MSRKIIGGAEHGTNFEDDSKYAVLFSIRNWKITVQTDEQVIGYGPSMWHKGCDTRTHVLCRSVPECAGCTRKIPARIQTVYTLLNLERSNNREYFCE